jgi:hypothetical protein
MEKTYKQYLRTLESYQDNEDLPGQMQRGRNPREVSPELGLFFP